MSRPTRPLHRSVAARGAALLAVAAVLALAGCSGGSDDKASDTTAAQATSTTTASASAEPIEVLVSNDDGYGAKGIDTLVEALREVDGVKVTVVAPNVNRSGTGSKTSDGEVEVTDVKTLSGYPAKAVSGFPADAVNVAMNQLDIQPDVVITGINEGQNVGPVVDLSGTVGAARAAVENGVPALATSQGGGTVVDYPAAVPLILDWLKTHRKAIAAGTEPVAVTNLNVPSCGTGKVRGLEETEVDLKGDITLALGKQDCTSAEAAADLSGDVELFANGFAVLTPVAAQPASQPAG